MTSFGPFLLEMEDAAHRRGEELRRRLSVAGPSGCQLIIIHICIVTIYIYK